MAKESLNPEIEFLAHDARLHCYLELCDRWGMETESQAMTEITERISSPSTAGTRCCLRTLRATLDGRFADAERLAEEALELARLSAERVRDLRLPLRADARDPLGAGPPARALARDPRTTASASRGSRAGGTRSPPPSSATRSRPGASSSATPYGASPSSRATATGSSMCALSPTRACSSATSGAASSSTSSCSPTPATTPSPTASSRSGLSRCASASSRRCSGAGRTPIATSRLRSPAASCSARGRSAPACCSSTRSAWPRAAKPATAGRWPRCSRRRRISAHELGMTGLFERVSALRAASGASRRPRMRSSGTRGSSGRSRTRGRCSASATSRGFATSPRCSPAPDARCTCSSS